MTRPAGPSLTLLPAVDVADGRAAQVVDGSTSDPLEVALRWVGHGAAWIHLVDLDLAFGRGDNAALLARLVERIPVPVQLSGGLADEESVRWAASTGADRIVLASAVTARSDTLARLLAEHGARLVPAVDVRDGQVVSRGTDLDLGPVAEVVRDTPALAEAPRVLVADASRDGTRTGADVELFAGLARLLGGEVVASGGVATLEDVRRLRTLTPHGVTEAVVGSALYHAAFPLEQALEVAR